MRKKIDTVFSQLCDQFMMQRNYAKSFTGFKAKVLAKLAGFTVLQFLNKLIYNRPVGRLGTILQINSTNGVNDKKK